MLIFRKIITVSVAFGVMFGAARYLECAEPGTASDTGNVEAAAAGKFKENEPNNIFGISNYIPADGAVSAAIAPVRDVDWYRLEVGRQGQLNIKISDVARELDIVVRVWNANKDVVSGWLAPLTRGGETEGTVDLPAGGVYSLEVRDSRDDAESAKAYTLTTSFDTAADMCEPNNSFGSAFAVEPGDTVAANILPIRDVDWYVIKLPHQGQLNVGIYDVAEELDIVFRVWNANKDVVSGWFAPLRKGAETVGVIQLPAGGRYYIEVRDNRDDARSIKPYRIGLTFRAAADAGEPNDSFGSAAIIEPGDTVAANILPIRDVDWYGVEVRRQGQFTVEINDVAEEMDIVFRVWNANKDVVSGWIAPLRKGAETVGSVDFPTGGKYYLEVRDSRDDACSIEPYRLTANFVATVDESEPNDRFEQAAEIKLNSDVSANILPLRDYDWYRVSVPDAGEVRVTVTDVPPDLDIGVKIYNSDKRDISGWIAPLRKGAETEGAVTVSEPGDYYIQVSDIRDDARSIKPYKLTVSMQ